MPCWPQRRRLWESAVATPLLHGETLAMPGLHYRILVSWSKRWHDIGKGNGALIVAKAKESFSCFMVWLCLTLLDADIGQGFRSWSLYLSQSWSWWNFGMWHFCHCCCWHLALLLLLLASGTFAGLILQVPGLWLEGIEEGAHLLTSPEIENKLRVWVIKNWE